MRWIDYIVFALVGVCLCYWWQSCNPSTRTITERRYLRDTVYQVVEKPITVKQLATKTVLRTKHDTLYEVEYIPCQDSGYIAQADTAFNGDTLNISYAHPAGIFSFVLRQKPDSIRTIYITDKETVTQPAGFNVIHFLLGAAAGFGAAALYRSGK